MNHPFRLVHHLGDPAAGRMRGRCVSRFGTVLRQVVTGAALAGLALLAEACPRETAVLHEVLPGVLVRHGLWPAAAPEGQDHHASSVVLWSGRGASVLDPGPSVAEGQALRQALACRGITRIERVFNSHAHAEQVLGNAAWHAPVSATAGTLAAMRQRCPDCLAALRRDLGTRALRGTHTMLPRQLLREGDTVQAGGRHWQVLELRAAHTESDLVLWSAADKLLLAGGLFDGQRLVLAQGSVAGWLEALDRLQALQPHWLVGQHLVAQGPAQVQAALAKQREALCSLVRWSWRGLDEGWSETEALNWLAVQGSPEAQRQQRFNLLRAWREMEALWLVQAPMPVACQGG